MDGSLSIRVMLGMERHRGEVSYGCNNDEVDDEIAKRVVRDCAFSKQKIPSLAGKRSITLQAGSHSQEKRRRSASL